MSYQNTMDAINLIMPSKVPRTEYSASEHWGLVKAVTGIDVNFESKEELKRKGGMAFEKAWDFGFSWSILTNSQIFGDCCTKMGHASFADGGTDFSAQTSTPFSDVSEVLSFDPFEAYGELDLKKLTAEYNEHYDRNLLDHPGQVNMTGIYVTMISGLLEIFGWNWLLEGMGEDADAFGAVANRYADWILGYFKALADCKSEVVMIHDDIVWTDGAFTHPNWYRKYVFPNYKRLFEPLHKAGKKILYTSDGTFTEFAPDIADCGINGFVMEPTTDMDYIAKNFGKTHAFVGNADCRILTFGSKQEIKREVERCFNIGREYPGFIMAVGNHIPSNVPVENALYYNECYEELACRSR